MCYGPCLPILKIDQGIVLAAVRRETCTIDCAFAAKDADLDFVLAAMMHSGVALRYASVALYSNREIVLAAV